MTEYEWTMYQIKVDYNLCYHALKSVLLYKFIYFFNFEKFGVKSGFLLHNSIKLLTQNFEKN